MKNQRRIPLQQAFHLQALDFAWKLAEKKVYRGCVMSGSREQQTGRRGNREFLFGRCQRARLRVDGKNLQVVGILPGDDQKRTAGSDREMPRCFDFRGRLADFR